ncbi:MAG: carbonic anhydrase [Pseudobdellovibrio sp.]
MNKSIYKLLVGFRRFREKYYTQQDDVYQRLSSDGQTPKTLLIGCSDSRVDPAILTDGAPGELFVIRNVANLVPPCEPAGVGLHGTSSAIEFAVVNLKVENIIVLGHRQCGGINALMSGATDDPKSFVGKWMSIAEEARKNIIRIYPDADHDTKWRMAEKESIKVSIKNLRTFPFIQEAIKTRDMNVVGIYFDLEQGELSEYDEASNEFKRLEI